MRPAVIACIAALLSPGAGLADEIVSASYFGPTDRYPHGVFGDPVEWGGLTMTLEDGRSVRLTLPSDHVFEDLAPRLADLDGDGDAEVVVIETDMAAGAAIAIYDSTGKLVETDHIGTPNRWLAIAGIADLDGDGRIEIAYVDRPHLARVLRVIEVGPGWTLADEAAAPGHSNHRFGVDRIEGGVFDCGTGPEIFTADAAWSRVLATRLEGRALIRRDIGPYTDPDSLTCR
ncbi:FG-GAP repeat domain-containing protein [Salibaculum griseiflavum]|uniref:VCBS repeat-containing protein n=1 Tax=Salibaculum griseiflavum TaxID=1914409 RepID=A0A2V1P627_9RHOB|nr:VCBS repeat-containing protein [Salibaculum griseiflavum]PWG17248.1 hypothetical protein DFK10_07625 [Salibaculum griseiflavum]